MKLLEATLYDYKSIIKSNIKVESDITCLVGLTGAGKTSILELLQRIGSEWGFSQIDLPEGGITLSNFLRNEIQAHEILQLEAKFMIEKNDRVHLPPEYKNVTEIILKRFFDGVWIIDKTVTGNSTFKINIDNELNSIKSIASSLQENIQFAEQRISEISDHIPAFITNKINFYHEIENEVDNLDITMQNFKNYVFSIPHDEELNDMMYDYLLEIENKIHEIKTKRDNDPDLIVYDLSIPHPQYISDLPDPLDAVFIDEYINNPSSYESFDAIGRICNLTKTSLNNIRNRESQTRKNFFDTASKTLTEEFGKFWSETKYELMISLDDNELILTVKDTISDKITKISQRSEGLRWILSLFFKIKLLASSSGLSHILLLDSPATAIHDAGKEEVRKFMTQMTEDNNMQIIYTTHEKALIDPWRLDRIRFVKKTKEKGTIIQEVKDNGIDSTRIEISKHIGSPAKYSLFGAPVTILFEGSSDYRFVAALNEYAIRSDKKHLNSDIYAINDMGGMRLSPN